MDELLAIELILSKAISRYQKRQWGLTLGIGVEMVRVVRVWNALKVDLMELAENWVRGMKESKEQVTMSSVFNLSDLMGGADMKQDEEDCWRNKFRAESQALLNKFCLKGLVDI